MRCGWDISKASERNWVQRMQYKVRLQEDAERKRKEPTYRVTNCHEHNQSLKKRGKISLHFPDGDLKSQFIAEEISAMTYDPVSV